jgi:hypothetical protein
MVPVSQQYKCSVKINILIIEFLQFLTSLFSQALDRATFDNSLIIIPLLFWLDNIFMDNFTWCSTIVSSIQHPRVGIVSSLPMMNPNVLAVQRSSVLDFIFEFRIFYTLLQSPNFLTYGAQESIPRNQFYQAV